MTQHVAFLNDAVITTSDSVSLRSDSCVAFILKICGAARNLQTKSESRNLEIWKVFVTLWNVPVSEVFRVGGEDGEEDKLAQCEGQNWKMGQCANS